MSKNCDYAKRLLAKMFITAVVLAISSNSVSAQSTFTENELKVLKNKATEKLKTTSYRSIYISKNLKTNDVMKKNVYEFVPPDRKHQTIEEIIFQIKVDPKKPIETRLQEQTLEKIQTYSEWIYTKDQTFYRRGTKEPWKIYVESEDSYGAGYGMGSGTGRGSGETPEITIEYKFTPNQMLRNQPCDLYEKITVVKYKNTEPKVETESYWFNKEEFLISSKSENSFYRETTDYEYDPNIKIEAPIKVDEVKPLKITSKPKADLTEAAVKNVTQGTVTLKVTFLSNGKIGKISVVKGLPDGLNESAVAAAKNIKFVPESKNGVAVTVTKQIVYNFTVY